ncbi:hypothetical protein GCM10020229_11900 [Kitasatospora albolonga]
MAPVGAVRVAHGTHGRREEGGPGEGVWRFSAVAHEASVPQTRHAVRDRLLAQGMAGEAYQELIDDVLLIVSELVGNAVTHAAVLSPHLTTELAIEGGWVRVSVEDGHPYRPKALESDIGQLGGRGLLLVKSVTLQAGGVCDVERTGEGGKVIWASLPLPEVFAEPDEAAGLPEAVLPGVLRPGVGHQAVRPAAAVPGPVRPEV